MRHLIVFSMLFCNAMTAFADEGPNPLQDVKVAVSISNSSSGVFTYKYAVSNPSLNNGSIYNINIFLSQDPLLDTPPPSNNLAQCQHYDKHTSANALKVKPITSVGSSAPNGWGCSYGRLVGFNDGVFGWGADDTPSFVNPGSSLEGFALTSYGLPSIRDAVIEPWIDVDELSERYRENVPLTIALH
ncbi:MAG: hypothetical protein KDD22_05960, partial [Bdellovibrionales bacterium]|nr:hypothetical protein [Bdellovibrionales bacterium]